MRRRYGQLIVFGLAVWSATGVVASLAAALQAQPSITYRVVSADVGNLDLYRFRFPPAASIPGPYPEPMLTVVSEGLFLLYLADGARVALNQGSTSAAQVATLKPIAKSGTQVTFADEPVNQGPAFACAPTCWLETGPGGVRVVGGATLGDVGIKLARGTVLHLPGTTPGFVCNVGEESGRLDVAVATRDAASTFSWLAFATQQASADASAADVAHGVPRQRSEREPLQLNYLPARNPGGGCGGRTG
ncbi:MAG: hypothetical protein QOF33_4347 [Thermomicrobiales bacterium]|jgi:hypothetical protein|nr:hypothetical protein [Thermomicrobiales bacterium]MEA2586262.1 hypothetical protein [Thermomicrobiales bacterium]